MAPRRGGGGSGGSTGGDGGDSGYSTSSCDSDWPCSTDMTYIYGNSYASLYSSSELLGQLVLYAIWLIVLTGLLFQSMKLRPRRPFALILAMTLFWISYVFLVVRFGLLVGNTSVPIGYRYESSVVILLQRLALPLLFLALTQQILPTSPGGKITKLILWFSITALLALNITYLVRDFLLSARALDEFEDSWVWRLGDRDLALTLTASEVVALTMTDGGYGGLSPYYVQGRFWEYGGDAAVSNRAVQIKIGVAAGFVALAIAGFITGVAGFTWVRRRSNFGKGMVWVFPASAGLLLSTIFAAIVDTYFVLWNWGVINDLVRWDTWIQSYPSVDTYQIIPPTGFLEGYRIAADGFPIVEAVLEPLGIVIACAALYMLARIGTVSNSLPVSNGVQKT